jgi:hypothetical protein
MEMRVSIFLSAVVVSHAVSHFRESVNNFSSYRLLI